MNTEMVVLLDEDGCEIGVAPKESVHTDTTPLHRAFSCYVFNDKKQLLVTRRADTKRVWPGVWTNSVCGHPGPGEADNQAIARRLGYELGMQAAIVQCLVKEYRYKTPPFKGIIEHEVCPIYLAESNGPVAPNSDEVSEIQWMEWEDYKLQLAQDTSDIFSWWCKDQLSHIEAKVDAYVGTNS